MNTATRSAAPFSPADTDPRTEAPPVRGDFNVSFEDSGSAFSALHAARKWLKARGFAVGSLQRGMPIGIMLGCEAVAKWRNLDAEDRAELHGFIKSPALSYRSGPVTVYIRRDAPHDVIEAFRTDPVDVEAREFVEGGR